MANLLDRASVVLSPTAYNNGEALCIKPDDASGDFQFSRNSAATRVNAQGLVETIGINLPRINYEAGCGSWLFEPQSTNLIPYSDDFTQWGTVGSPTITSNYGISPDGTQNSTRVQFSTNDRIFESVSASGDITFSVYLKGSGTIRFRDNGGTNTLDVTLTSEWTRYILSFNATITNIQLQKVGSGSTDLQIWGAQVEALSYPTSLILTSGSTVTRNQDVCTNGGSLASINSTEGTLYAEIKRAEGNSNSAAISLNDGTSSNGVSMYFFGVNNFYVDIFSSSGTVTISAGVVSISDYIKVAVKYKNGNSAIWINGIEVGTNSSAVSLVGLNQLLFKYTNSTLPFFGKTKALAVWKEALSDSELQSLTTI